MTEIEVLKKQAYNIAVNSCDYDLNKRNEAMKNYALLVIAEAISKRKEE